MVRRAFGLSSLNRKLLRDLVAMKGQAMAIALVMAAGVSMFVTYLSNFDSLERTKEAYYARQRFADLFATVKRAPDRLVDRLRAIPGIDDVETRVVADVVLDLPDLDEPASGRLVSIPSSGRPRLNDLFLRAGRWVATGKADEVIASESFVIAHGFHPGDRFGAIINGRRRELTIVAVALSPEYVYSLRAGELVPDAKRFGVFWMERDALASAFDMNGGFNDVAMSLSAGASASPVIAAVDRLLQPYGGFGASRRANQLSNWTVENEIQQLRTFGFFIPLIFLTVAAFVLNVALTRALALQRPQLAALKALGFTNREIGWHYLKLGLFIALAGAVVGIVLGAWMGSGMLRLYTEYFKFPILQYSLSGGLVIAALAITTGTAFFGAWAAVRRAVRIAPAEAMRPEAPARYRPSVLEARWLIGGTTIALRMILRNLQRHPVRAFTTIAGIACGVAILEVGIGLIDSFDLLISREFTVAERQDVTISFVEPVSERARYDVARLPGVLHVEPQRAVPIRMHAGARERSLAIIGLPAVPDLKRPIGRDGRLVPPAAGGLVISAVLAHALRVEAGDTVTVDILEGRQPRLPLVVAGTVDDILGISAYMEIGELHRLMQEDATLSSAALLIDRRQERALSAALKRVPAVAAVAPKHVAIENFRKTMAENMGLTLTLNVVFASIIAFGVVYNAARVSLSERSRELASLRVLGFTRAEISMILLGELAILTVASLPAGVLLGYALTAWLVSAFESEIYRFPLGMTVRVMAFSALTVIAASAVSGLFVRRQLDRLDLVAVLKLRE